MPFNAFTRLALTDSWKRGLLSFSAYVLFEHAGFRFYICGELKFQKVSTRQVINKL